MEADLEVIAELSYQRDGEGEGEVVPVEVKIGSEVKKRDAAPLFKFLYRHKAARGYIISDGTEAAFSGFSNGYSCPGEAAC